VIVMVMHNHDIDEGDNEEEYGCVDDTDVA
jgi:hypothetical protein